MAQKLNSPIYKKKYLKYYFKKRGKSGSERLGKIEAFETVDPTTPIDTTSYFLLMDGTELKLMDGSKLSLIVQ